jgi:uncharacterized protein (UPF0297 family)
LKEKFRLSLFLILTLTFLICSVANAMELNINVHTGEKYSFHEVEQLNAVYTLYNREVEEKMMRDVKLYMEILSVDKNKNATIRYRFDSIKISGKFSGEIINFDSTEGSSSNLFADIFNSYIGKSFTAKIDKKGHVMELHGVNDILYSLLDSLPGYEQNKEEARKIILKILSDNILKRKLKMEYYPDKNVDVGDTWESKDAETMKPATITKQRKIIDERDGVLHIEINEVVDTTASDLNNKIKLKGTVSGRVDIDKKNGLLQFGYGDGDIQGEFEKTSPQGEKVIVPVRMFGKITCEITKQ